MMTKNKNLTNEILSKIFKDNFQMAFYAIEDAREKIYSGKEVVPSELLEEMKKKLKHD